MSPTSVSARLSPYAGSLLALPLLLFVAGSSWTWHSTLVPARGLLASLDGRPVANHPERRLRLRDPGEGSLGAARVAADRSLVVDLERARRHLRIELQAEANDRYVVSGSQDGRSYRTLFVAEPKPQLGLATRTSPVVATTSPVRFLRVHVMRGDGHHVVSGLRVHERTWELDHRLIALPVWLLWITLTVLSRFDRAEPWTRRVLSAWARCDVAFAGVFGLAVLLGFSLDSLLVLAAIALVFGAPVLARRLLATPHPAAWLSVALSVGLLLGVAPWLLAGVITDRVGETHELDVDHRMRPDGRDINIDGLRFRGRAAHLREEDFVILFMGDSFAYGNGLSYEDSYAYAFERVLHERGFGSVRVVNMGWVSSSPLLGLRLLRDLGTRYHPDLVIYNLDLTDFHDDLRYAAELRRGAPAGPGPYGVIWRAARRRSALLSTLERRWLSLRQMDLDPEVPGSDGSAAHPADPFFVVNQPLALSEPWIAQGVMRSLDAIARHCDRTLQVPLALALFPRAFQYSTRESPKSWERSLYSSSGPHKLAPFAYFDQNARGLPYPVVSLLEDFQNTDRFPLYFDDDPHWNTAGARFAAEALATKVARLGLLPPAGGSWNRGVVAHE